MNFKRIKDTSQFNEDFIKNYNGESDEKYFLVVDIQNLEELHELHNDLPFLPQRMKIAKVRKLEANSLIKTEYVIPIGNLKQALNHRLGLKTVQRVIKIYRFASLKPYIDFFVIIDFFKLMNNAVF